jgi:hypothetical protein
MALPASAAITGTRSMAGSSTNLVTLTTSTAHKFSVGDSIAVNIGLTGTSVVTNRAATTTVATITTSAAHNYSVGETIVVSAVGARYNGTFSIASIPTTTTLTYALNGGAESTTSAAGTVQNTTISAGYNGTKIIETIPTTTSLTYYYYDQAVSTSSTLFGGTPTVTDNTNTALNGNVTITSVTGSTQFSYTMGA